MSIDLEAIEARLKAATPGPWINRPEKSFNVQSVNKNIASCFRTENADFIAHSREDIPALLAEVERLNAELYPEKELEEQRAKRWEAEKRLLQKTREQLASVTAERDAAIADINLLEDCSVCKHHDCDSCDLAGTECRFEWRGAGKEQNDG